MRFWTPTWKKSKRTGDLLLHMVFYAKLGSELPKEQGGYDIADALHSICDKLVERHPHIYGMWRPTTRKQSRPIGRN